MGYEIFLRREGDGFWVIVLAGENLSAKKLVYLDNAGAWRLADADAVVTMSVFGITMDTIDAGLRGKILLWGFIGDPTWSWTLGAELYASTTPGELTETAPSGVGDQPQVVAVAVEADKILFTPRDSAGGMTPSELAMSFVTINAEAALSGETRHQNVLDANRHPVQVAHSGNATAHHLQVIRYETQVGAIAEPAGATNDIIIVYNSTQGRVFLWVYDTGTTSWKGIEIL